MSAALILIPLFALLLPAAKAPETERIVLLPSADGRPSGVFVKSAKGEALIDKPYLSANVSASGIAPRPEDPTAVQARYRTTLDALPEAAVSFTVYFDQGSERLSTASWQQLADVRARISRRAVPEVAIVGHTERMEAPAMSDELSAARADAIRRVLLADGIDDARITIVARGSRDAVATKRSGDPEPLNRRADILVR